MVALVLPHLIHDETHRHPQSSVLKHSHEILSRQDAMAARGWGVRGFYFGGFADVSRGRKTA